MGDGQQVGEELWRDVGPVKAGSRSVATKEGKRLDVGMEMRETICEAKGGHQVGQGWAPFVPEGPSCVYWPQNTIEVPYEQGGGRKGSNGISYIYPKEVVPVGRVVGARGGVDMEEGD